MSTSVYTGLKPFNFIRHHSSTGLYCTLSAQRLSKRAVYIKYLQSPLLRVSGADNQEKQIILRCAIPVVCLNYKVR